MKILKLALLMLAVVAISCKDDKKGVDYSQKEDVSKSGEIVITSDEMI